MEQTITLDGISFEYVKMQRGDTAIYRAHDRYMRIGPPETIARYLGTHRRMEAAGFPVPPIISSGTRNTDAYFTEQVLGEKTFRVLFADDIAEGSRIRDEHFDSFVAISRAFVIAQLKTAQAARDPADFARGIRLDMLCAELPAYADRIAERFGKALTLMKDLPYVLTHGDFNPANMYPAGVIDLEDSFMAPIGYDPETALMTIEWFPRSAEFEYFAQYTFTDEQKLRYYAMCDEIFNENGLPALSGVREEFAFCRAVWLSVRMHEWPRIQKFRYDLFVKKYLS